jgi:UDP:flavonoid glycosyltransferase YjiC (YdhE family)
MPIAARRILFTTLPTPSHLRTVAPVAAAAQRLGHTVAVAGSPGLASSITNTYGLTHFPAGVDWLDDPALSHNLAATLLHDGNAAFCGALVAHIVGPQITGMTADILRIAGEFAADCVVWECSEYSGYLAATALQLQHFSLDNGFLGLMSRYRDQITRSITAHAATLGLPAAPNPFDVTTLTPLPRALFLPDFRQQSVVAYNHEPPARTGERLPSWVPRYPAGVPLIYASLGTILTCGQGFEHTIHDAYERIIEAFSYVHCNAIVSVGRGNTQHYKTPANVRLVEHAPQPLLLRAGVTAMVSHCGFKTVCECVSNAVPIVGYPLSSDQYGHHDRIKALGISPATPPAPSVVEIAAALQEVITNPTYTDAARHWQRLALTSPPLQSAITTALNRH